jgi:hypothetical protein
MRHFTHRDECLVDTILLLIVLFILIAKLLNSAIFLIIIFLLHRIEFVTAE